MLVKNVCKIHASVTPLIKMSQPVLSLKVFLFKILALDHDHCKGSLKPWNKSVYVSEIQIFSCVSTVKWYLWKHFDQVGHALKASKKIGRNNQTITACCIKIDYFEITLNQKLTMIHLMLTFWTKKFLTLSISCYNKREDRF